MDGLHDGVALIFSDFSMIYEVVNKNKALFLENEIKIDDDAVILNQFGWRQYEFERVRLRFRECVCYKSMDDMSIDEEKQNAILSNMDNGMKEWTEVELNDGSESGIDLRKMGGVIQAKSFYSYGNMDNIQLYGPYIDDKVMVKGKMGIPIFNQEQKENKDEEEVENDTPSILILHEEEWDLRQNKENDRMFEGKYIVRQRNQILDVENVDPNGEQMQNFAPMDWFYDLEITIK